MAQSGPYAIPSDLLSQQKVLEGRYEKLRDAKLNLDMTRGKPCSEQLDLSLGLLEVLGRDDYKSPSGTDCRNYGGIDGLPEVKELLRPLLGVETAEILIGGNSSLTLMYDTVAHALSHGVPGSKPWREQGPVKFLCPSPGYDRHFAVCEHFGIEMLVIDQDESGPDRNVVERMVADDESIKGIWLVPRFSNPTGYTLADETVQRLASMKTAAEDFRIFWDNAYSVHTLEDGAPEVANILTTCKNAGTPHRPFLFGSTSKISFAGAGIAVMGGSTENLDWMRGHLSKSTIGPDKLNQLRHLRFFENWDGVVRHMGRHAAIIKPKFDAVQRILQSELGDGGIASWTEPKGGYFVSFDTQPGCARRVVELAAQVGVKLTQAGATFPYGKDPEDRNIRIAPTLPSPREIEAAMEVFCVCVKLATIERYR